MRMQDRECRNENTELSAGMRMQREWRFPKGTMPKRMLLEFALRVHFKRFIEEACDHMLMSLNLGLIFSLIHRGPGKT